ncbi:DUF1028 domain-containing protein [Fodinibius sp. SL11]|uniref:DUF1028 domain-containing protein n=1 Tax=Fodinibius sp. SL11 TaxID=3425690 RepID=UPI003F885924
MKRFLLTTLVFVTFCTSQSFSQHVYNQDEPLSHTFSIVARDSVTGDLGVAVQSHWFSVGSSVTWAEAGVGAIATQSLTNVSFGPRGLDLLKQGYTAQETLDSLIASDEGRAYRQVAIIDSKGRVAAYTGDKCIAAAGHITGNQYSVQSNMMLNGDVWPAMSKAYSNADGTLAERMVAALEAAQKAGGDIRGQQSAALLVVRGESTGKVWQDRKIDLRVEDDSQAVNEIARLLKVKQAYDHMNAGDIAIEQGDVDKALTEYGEARDMFPNNMEMTYWTAVSMANADRIEQSLPLFRQVFREDTNWVTLTKRITKNGMLSVSDSKLEQILNAHK